MQCFNKGSKGTNSERSIFPFGEFIELELLRHQIFHSTLNFNPKLIRDYLDSKEGKDLEEKIFTAIG